MKLSSKGLFGLFFAVGMFSFILHGPSLFFGFDLYDTPGILRNHPNLYNEDSFMASLRAIFTDFPREEPLLFRDLSWAFDARVFGFKNPFGYHLGNVILHALNTVLLAWVLFRSTEKLAFALLTTLAWASLAIHAETVSWIMGRKDLLVTLMTLTALALTREALSIHTRPRLRTWIEVAIIPIAGLAGLAKTNGLVVFALLFLYRYFIYDLLDDAKTKLIPRAPLWASALRYLPHFALSLGVFLGYRSNLLAWGNILNTGAPSLSLIHAKTLLDYLPWVLAKSLWLIFTARELSSFYAWPTTGIPWSETDMLASRLFLIFFVWGAAWILKAGKKSTFALLFFLTAMLPYLNLTYIGIWVANRYLYLASVVPVAGLCALPLMIRADRLRRLVSFALAIWMLSSVLTTRAFAEAWRDEESLFEYEVTLKHPTLNAFNMAMDTRGRQIQNPSTSPEVRAKALAETGELLKRAFELVKEHKIRPDPVYGDHQAGWLAVLYRHRALYQHQMGAPFSEIEASLKQSLDYVKLSETYILYASFFFLQSLQANSPSQRQARIAEASQMAIRAYQAALKREDHAKLLDFLGKLPVSREELPPAITKLQALTEESLQKHGLRR